MVGLVVIFVTAALNLLVGAAVYLKNPRSYTGRFFFALTGVFVIWSFVNQVSIHPILIDQIWWIRLVLFFAALLNLFVFLTFLAFPEPTFTPRRKQYAKFASIATLLVMCLILTPLVFARLNVINGRPSPVPAPGIVLFLLQTVGLVGLSLIIITLKFRHSRGRAREQLRLILLGIAGTFSLIVVTNFLLVILFNITALVPIGPAFTLIFSTTFAYAIIKEGLFDIRTATARLLAYILSLGVLGVIYGVVIFALASLVPPGKEMIAQLVYVALAMITALLYPVTKRLVARLTSRLFYQDMYDPQQLYNSLNKILVANIELDKLLAGSLEVINNTIRPETSAVVVTTKDSPRARVFGNFTDDLNRLTVTISDGMLMGMHNSAIVTDLLVEEGNREILKTLRMYDVGLLAQLIDRVDGGERKVLGYIIFGPKKSGRLYDGQDIRVVETVANELVIAIQNALRFEEIEKFNVTLQEEVARATGRLQRANRRLEELDNTKDDFISMASHQLRTPLTSVKGYLSMVIEGDAGKINPTQSKMLSQAFSSAQRMVFLITDLLNVSRLKTGKFVIEPAPTNLAKMVQEEVEQLTEAAHGKRLTLSYKKPTKFPEVMLDETKIRQVIMNFIDNAIYYTPSGGHIRVELEDKPQVVELRVVDDGMGVPKAEQHHLFTKFYRAANARQARPDGTGLGLFMAQKVIMAQGGSIIFSSKEGRGSTFGFVFAKSRLQPTAAAGQPGVTTEAKAPAGGATSAR